MPGPAYRVTTPRLVMRCWNPEDAPLLKAAQDASQAHLSEFMPWARVGPEDLRIPDLAERARDPAITETFAMAGFDFIAIDMEHTTLSLTDARTIITSAQSEGACCLPRPVSHSNDILKPLLEAGADGMFIQMVETPEQGRALIDAMKFPPEGKRSYGVNRAHGYGFDFADYITEWNASSSLILPERLPLKK